MALHDAAAATPSVAVPRAGLTISNANGKNDEATIARRGADASC